MFVVSVMYPSGGKFDHDHYMKVHMPLVDAKWRSHGLKGWQVLRATGAASGEPAYTVVTLLTFDSQASFQAAAAESGKEVMGDIPNFTDRQPVLQFNEPVSG